MPALVVGFGMLGGVDLHLDPAWLGVVVVFDLLVLRAVYRAGRRRGAADARSGVARD
jgi:hypothetical protein